MKHTQPQFPQIALYSELCPLCQYNALQTSIMIPHSFALYCNCSLPFQPCNYFMNAHSCGCTAMTSTTQGCIG